MVYYVETNVIAIVISIILLIHGTRLSSKGETSQMIVNSMLISLLIISVSDIAAYCSRGVSLPGVHISNIIYFISMGFGCYLWFLFVMVKTSWVAQLKKAIFFTCIPMLILCIGILVNPITGFFFTVDEELLYHRGPGVMVSWIVEWAYLLIALVIIVIAITKEKGDYKRKELKGYLLFAIPMAAAAIVQMLVYGTTVTQIGFMLALLLITMNKHHFQVHRDYLTGINNKNSFLNYRDSLIGKTRAWELTLFMIDADKFKLINDTYGHMTGDQALQDVAEILKDACAEMHREHLQLFRYAGDEFVIIGSDMTPEDIEALKVAIENHITLKNEQNQAKGEKYQLSLSVGHATRVCTDVVDFDQLVADADKEMYRVKKMK